MNSTIEYIRQLNQTSVTIQDNWLDRLRFVDAGRDSQSVAPEIVLSERSNIPRYKEGHLEPPITIVNRDSKSTGTRSADSSEQRQSSQPRMLDEEATVPMTVQSLEELHEENVHVVSSPVMADTVYQTVCAGPMTSATMNTAHESADKSTSETSIVSGNTSRDETGSTSPYARPADTEMMTHFGAKVQRATVVEQRENTNIVHPNSQATTSAGNVIKPQLTTAANVTARQETVVPQAATETTQTTPTPAAAELEHDPRPLTSTAATTNQVNQSTVTPVAETNTPSNPKSVSGSTHKELETSGIACSFPSDKTSERFVYAKTKRQKLVDTIVDQIVERFPLGSCPTIMLVGANREIDVDSAASRIATCLATRQIGRVLLVDGNTSSRTLTALLDLNQQPGVIEAWVQDSPATSSLQKTDHPELFILPSGDPKHLQGVDTLPPATTTNRELKEHFDYTIITAGNAGDLLTDSWAGTADGVYLIVDMDESDRDSTMDTVDHFRQIGTRIVGCIATRA